MYTKSWRYYRDVILYGSTLMLVLIAVRFAFIDPAYWVLAIFLWLAQSPIRAAFYFAHPPRGFRMLSQPLYRFEEVNFKSRDGLPLFGRYIHGPRKVTVILIHELSNSSVDMFPYIKFLSEAGYGIFAIDLRAHGFSNGDTSTFGLREADDVVGAVDYLEGNIKTAGRKCAVLGISLGAQAALRGALKSDKIQAVVLDGLGPSVLSDHGGRPDSPQRWINYPYNWLYYQIFHLMSGGKDLGVLEVIGKIAPRPLLMIASGSKDIYFNRLFFQAANEPKEIWEIPKGFHGGGILEQNQQYAEHVVKFLEEHLS